jgi:nicotinamide-nucleotide adenylyltransferase
MKALFVGRFQPFHLGHLSAIQDIWHNGADEIVITIGSAQYSGTADNPFDLATRQAMIDNALKNERINYCVVAVPDIHDETRWVEHLVKITGPVDVVHTGNELVARLFKEKNYPVQIIKKNLAISATAIRTLIRAGSDDWHQLVPAAVANLI